MDAPPAGHSGLTEIDCVVLVTLELVPVEVWVLVPVLAPVDVIDASVPVPVPVPVPEVADASEAVLEGASVPLAVCESVPVMVSEAASTVLSLVLAPCNKSS